MSQPSHSQQAILESLNQSSLKTNVPWMDIGDTINVHCRIVEGDKERVQVFQGVLIARRGRGANQMITVRRVVDEIGIERKFPFNSPMIAKFEVVRHGDARRAKLYYLRDRVGKSRRLRDRRRGMKNIGEGATAMEPAKRPAKPKPEKPEPAAATA